MIERDVLDHDIITKSWQICSSFGINQPSSGIEIHALQCNAWHALNNLPFQELCTYMKILRDSLILNDKNMLAYYLCQLIFIFTYCSGDVRRVRGVQPNPSISREGFANPSIF